MAHYQPGRAQVPATRCAGLQVRRRAFASATGFFVLQMRGGWIRDSIKRRWPGAPFCFGESLT